MPARLLLALTVLVLCALSAGCGARPGDEGGEGSVRVVATTTQVADMVRSVSPGADVTQILQPNSDPHDYEPRPSDARAIERADVVFRSGGEVDEWMDDLIEANGGERARGGPEQVGPAAGRRPALVAGPAQRGTRGRDDRGRADQGRRHAPRAPAPTASACAGSTAAWPRASTASPLTGASW